MGFFSAIAVAVGGTAIYLTGGIAAPLILPALGFGSVGVGSGTVAASAMSYYGNVAAGSAIAKMTSMAMLAPTP